MDLDGIAIKRSPTVITLAQAAYDNPAPSNGHLDSTRIAILADALEEIGHRDVGLLRHLREARDGDGADPPMFGLPTRIAAIESERRAA